MTKRIQQTPQGAIELVGMGTFRPHRLPIMGLSVLLSVLLSALSALNVAHANDPAPLTGVIDTPVAAGTAPSVEQVKKQVSQEQGELANKEREELEQLAANGERLAQVALGADFADEAQDILFAPAAANAALSDALAWYSLAAQRGYPGTRSLNNSGVKFHPIRVVRNR